MTISNKNIVLAATLICASLYHGTSEARDRIPRGFSPSENRLATTIVNLFERLLDDNDRVIGSVYSNGQTEQDDDYVALKIIDYTPAIANVSSSPQRSSPSRSSTKFSAQKIFSRLVVSLQVRHWEDISSLKFLQHPSLKATRLPACLKKLEVSRCSISELDIHKDSFLDYAIRILNLSENIITTLMDNGTKSPLHTLYDLDLSANGIKKLGFTFTRRSQLKSLSLRGNVIEKLDPYCMQGLNDLEYLDLAENCLFDESLCKESFVGIGSNLDDELDLHIDLAENFLRSLPPLQELSTRLAALNLNENPLSKIDKKGYKLSHLSLLDIVCRNRSEESDNLLLEQLTSRVSANCTIRVLPLSSDNQSGC